MFDDENPPITDEERARISHKFRAAKALLARKRPRLLHSHPPISQCSNQNHSANPLPYSSRVADLNANEASGCDNGAKRVPLAEISGNSPLLKSFAIATDAGSNGLRLDCFKTPLKNPECESHNILQTASSNELGLDCFKTPLKILECERHNILQTASSNGLGLDCIKTPLKKPEYERHNILETACSNGLGLDCFKTPLKNPECERHNILQSASSNGLGLDCFKTPLKNPECERHSILQTASSNELELDCFKTPLKKPEFERHNILQIASSNGLGLDCLKSPLKNLECERHNTLQTASSNGLGLDCFKNPVKNPQCERHNILQTASSNGLGLDCIKTPLKIPECGRHNILQTASSKGLGLDCFKTPLQNPECERHNILQTSSSKGLGLDCFKTTVKSPECESTRNSFSAPSILDDDFDESTLQEIDALCEQNSSARAEGKGSHSVSHAANQDDGTYNGDLSSIDLKYVIGSESIVTKELSCSSDASESRAEWFNSDTATKKIGTMPEEYSKYLFSLNDRQQEAACNDISIPLMIVAGPGSGKTSTMVGRVLMLLNEGISPSNILAMTFTTAAASEMRDRVGAVAGKKMAKELVISTFHSFSLQLCRLHAEKLERTSDFLIYGHGQQRRAIIESVRLLESEKSKQKLDSNILGDASKDVIPSHFKDKSKKWQTFVPKAKACGTTSAELLTKGDKTGAAVLDNYTEILKSCNALDYHDLISCSLKLLTDFPEVYKECLDSWKAIIIDEFQDTSSMQYKLLRILASHRHITIVGDDDQSIFSFNGADISGFDSFRKDFPTHKEIRLNKNYRSTGCIIDAASSLIRNNKKRCPLKDVQTDNSTGSKITIKECNNADAQCSFVIDKIMEITSNCSASKGFGSFAVLYRRQISGKIFQTAFRERKIPFNVHGVAFYRKKAVKTIMALLKTTFPDCDDGAYRQALKALFPFEKEEKKRIINHIDKISTVRKCRFITVARDIFSSKISGTLKRSQLSQGRKVLSTLEMISRLVLREQSISTVITSVSNMLPEKYLLEQQATVNVDGGKLLNEDNDIRSVLQYLLDDVSNFLSSHFTVEEEGKKEIVGSEPGCLNALKAFVDHISEREKANFCSRRLDNKNSVTLTTIHQSKGLEWDVVFIIKANESEIPLLHESRGMTMESGNSIEEERRLLYVAMTRAREKLFILYVLMDSDWQILQPSRFLKEIPDHVREIQAEVGVQYLQKKHHDVLKPNMHIPLEKPISADLDVALNDPANNQIDIRDSEEPMEIITNGNSFLKRFHVDNRANISHLFHQWAKKKAFQDPKRLIDKVGFVIDERLRVKKCKSKEVLRTLKLSLTSVEALQYAEYVLRWEQIPADKRALLMHEKQEHFQKLRIEKSMGSSAATEKQISYLHNLGCTITPTSRLHASSLIEQYKSL